MAEHADAAIVDRIYEAAVVPEQWPGVLDILADIAGAEGTVLIASDMQNLRWISSDAILPFMDGFLNGDWARNHTRLWKLIEADHAGFIREDDVYTQEEYDNDVFINGLLKPLGIGWATATAIQVPTGDSLMFSIERRFDRGRAHRRRGGGGRQRFQRNGPGAVEVRLRQDRRLPPGGTRRLLSGLSVRP